MDYYVPQMNDTASAAAMRLQRCVGSFGQYFKISHNVGNLECHIHLDYGARVYVYNIRYTHTRPIRYTFQAVNASSEHVGEIRSI